MARRLAVVGHGLYGSRERVARRANDQDYLGYDENLDRVPQQRWLKTTAGDRGFALRSSDLLTLMTSARAGLGPRRPACIMASHELSWSGCRPSAAAQPRAVAGLPTDVGRSPVVRVVIDRMPRSRQRRKAFLGEQKR